MVKEMVSIREVVKVYVDMYASMGYAIVDIDKMIRRICDTSIVEVIKELDMEEDNGRLLAEYSFYNEEN